jgi:hypothetical protein
MKPLLFTGCLLIATLPSLAAADGRRAPPPAASAESAMTLLPIAVDQTEPRSAATLRESLRQPYGGVGESQPYRLSAQERQRMRDQLRAQSSRDDAKH